MATPNIANVMFKSVIIMSVFVGPYFVLTFLLDTSLRDIGFRRGDRVTSLTP